MEKIAKVTVEISTDPRMDLTRYPLFASIWLNGRQMGKRGSRAEITRWIEQARAAAEPHGITVEVSDDTARYGY